MLSRSDYRNLDAVAMAQGVHDGDFTPEDLLTAALREAEMLNPSLNAIVHFDKQLGLASAARVSIEQPLAGVCSKVKAAYRSAFTLPEGWATI